jgi:DNA-binding CsgD family transcriptional regulator
MLEKLNRLTNIIYQNALDGQWSLFLEALRLEMNSYNAWLSFIYQHNLSPIFTDAIFSAPNWDLKKFTQTYFPLIQEDPFYVKSTKLKELECKKGSDLIQADELHRTAIYPLFESAGVEHIVFSIPVRNNQFDSFVVLQRNKHQPDYTTEEIKLLKLLTPHIKRAFIMHHFILQQNKQLSVYKSIIGNIPTALIAVTELSEIKLINQAAESILLTQSTLLISNNKLVVRDSILNKKLREFIKTTLSWHHLNYSAPIAINLNNGNKDIILQAYPILLGNVTNDVEPPICVIEIYQQRQPNWPLFAKSNNITPKEVRTVTSLYEGDSLKTIANKYSVSINTVKTQLLSVFRKLGISSQKDLMVTISKY